MKNRSKTLLVGATAVTLIALSLAACDSNVPGKKAVTAKPINEAAKVEPAGAAFKGQDTLKASDIPKDGKDGKPSPK